MMLPQENSYRLADNSVTLRLTLLPELFWFKGHFPTQAILPGVTQLHLVMYYANKFLNIDLPFQGVDNVKFQRPLFPNESVELTIQWQPESHKLHFQYRSNDSTASSGRIALAERQLDAESERPSSVQTSGAQNYAKQTELTP